MKATQFPRDPLGDLFNKTTILEEVAKILKCRPEDVVKKTQALLETSETLRSELEDLQKEHQATLDHADKVYYGKA